jgi:hypothetical protein
MHDLDRCGREGCISWPTLSEALWQSTCDMPNEALAPCTLQPPSRLQPLEPQSAGAWQSSCATVALLLTVVAGGPGEILCKVRVAGARVCARYSVCRTIVRRPVLYRAVPCCIPVTCRKTYTSHPPCQTVSSSMALVPHGQVNLPHVQKSYLCYPASSMSRLSHGSRPIIILPCPETAPRCRHTGPIVPSWRSQPFSVSIIPP